MLCSCKSLSYVEISLENIPVEGDLLCLTTNWVFVVLLFPFDHNGQLIPLEGSEILIECINEETGEVLRTAIDIHDENLVSRLDNHYEIKHMLLKTGIYKMFIIVDSITVLLDDVSDN